MRTNAIFYVNCWRTLIVCASYCEAFCLQSCNMLKVQHLQMRTVLEAERRTSAMGTDGYQFAHYRWAPIYAFIQMKLRSVHSHSDELLSIHLLKRALFHTSTNILARIYNISSTPHVRTDWFLINAFLPKTWPLSEHFANLDPRTFAKKTAQISKNDRKMKIKIYGR